MLNPRALKKVQQAFKNRYFRRRRLTLEQRSQKELRRVMYWERVLKKWETRLLN